MKLGRIKGYVALFPLHWKGMLRHPFFVIHQWIVLWAHIRRGGHRFASCSRYIGKGCFGILFLLLPFNAFETIGPQIILKGIFSLNFFNHVHCLRIVQPSIWYMLRGLHFRSFFKITFSQWIGNFQLDQALSPLGANLQGRIFNQSSRYAAGKRVEIRGGEGVYSEKYS